MQIRMVQLHLLLEARLDLLACGRNLKIKRLQGLAL